MFSGVRSISNWMRVSFAFLATLVLVLSAPLTASAAGITADSGPALVTGRVPNIVSSIILSPRSPNIVKVGQPISLAFHYNTTALGGVVISVTPITGTAATPSSATCWTPVLPVGAGTGTCAFSVGAGPVLVNGIMVQMWSGSTNLFHALLPVNYQVAAGANVVSDLAFSLQTPNVVQIGKGVSAKFNYTTNQAGGVRIILVPFTGTAITPNAVTCGSTIYPTGSGTGSCRFSVSAGVVDVNSLHLQIWDANHVTMLAQQVIPVLYHFRAGATLLTNTSFSPQTPNFERLGNKMTVHFNYQTNQAAGVIVVAVPYTGTAVTAGATLFPSALLPVTTTTPGKGSAAFSISGSAVRVTSVLIRVVNSTNTTVLFSVVMPVNYQVQ